MTVRLRYWGFPEASIEAVRKFRQITGQVLATDAMIHSMDIAVDVGDQGMNRGKQSGPLFFSKPVTAGT